MNRRRTLVVFVFVIYEFMQYFIKYRDSLK